MADGRHFEKKPVKSPYLGNRLPDFDAICTATHIGPLQQIDR